MKWVEDEMSSSLSSFFFFSLGFLFLLTIEFPCFSRLLHQMYPLRPVPQGFTDLFLVCRVHHSVLDASQLSVVLFQGGFHGFDHLWKLFQML